MGISHVTDETNKVTRHKIVPEDLQACEIRYRRLSESERDGILILDDACRKINDDRICIVKKEGSVVKCESLIAVTMRCQRRIR